MLPVAEEAQEGGPSVIDQLAFSMARPLVLTPSFWDRLKPPARYRAGAIVFPRQPEYLLLVVDVKLRDRAFRRFGSNWTISTRSPSVGTLRKLSAAALVDE
jgi:hypothetical protein